MNDILLMNIKSTPSVTSLCHSMISGGILYVYILTYPWVVCVILTFSDPRFGPKMSSALRMVCIIIGQLGIRFLSIILVGSFVEGLSMMI